MEYFNNTGKMALGSRLRLLTAKVTEGAAEIYELYGMEFSPKWFPVLFVLSDYRARSVTDIAVLIGHSQPSVTCIVKEMNQVGLIKDHLDTKDKRTHVVGLTEKGRELAFQIIKVQGRDITQAIDQMNSQAEHNLWEAIKEWERLLEQKSLLERVREQKKLRESADVKIVPYRNEYQPAFKQLNEQWISQYFEMEATDYKILNHPESYILDKGGKILVALYKDEPMGVCALLKMDDEQYDYEMSKMAVSPNAQGKGVGWLLGQAVIALAKDLNAHKIYLESHPVLKPAIHLYHKLGFKAIAKRPSPYKRVGIQMELDLNHY